MKDGFLLLNKEVGWTSFDVCKKLSHKFSFRKIGHNGTLDPFATGLLLVAYGDACKLLSFIENDKKTYVARLKLGKKTSTGDLTGEIIEEKSINPISRKVVEKVILSLTGAQKQVPPMTSAVHFNGRKLYELAHEGKTVDRAARDVFIHEISLLDLADDEIVFKATVSKGTYIRTLGETIAELTDNVGYLESLERVAIGDFKIEQAKTINEINLNNSISMFDVMKTYMPVYRIKDEDTLKKVRHGGKLSLKIFEENSLQYLVVDENNEIQAVYKLKENEHYYCARNLNNSDNL